MRHTAPLRRTIRPSPAALFEQMESRLMLSFDPSANEQYMLELLNRMRTNPAAELGLFTNSLTGTAHSADADINAALSFFQVHGPTLQGQWNSLVAAQPLAWNEKLYDAATGHSQTMIDHDQQSHQVIDGLFTEPAFEQRLPSAGYNFSLGGENIYAFAKSVFYGHAGLAIDWGGSLANGGIQNPPGHRNNMMNNTFREIGISVIPESSDATDVGPLVITQDLGTRTALNGSSYLLGVVYDDTNENNFYTAGEGLAGVTITATPLTGAPTPIVTTSMTAGGYQLLLTSGVHYSVTFSGPGLSSDVTFPDISMSSANVKQDLKAGDSIPRSDLTATIDADALPAALVPGQAASVDVNLENIGVVSANGSIAIKLYASADGVLNTAAGGDKLLTTLTNQTIALAAEGGTGTIAVPFTVPAGLFGVYTLFAQIDSADAIDESNETNNVASEPASLNVLGTFGTIAGRANNRLTVTDADGTLVTFAMSGPGIGSLVPSGNAYDINITGTSAKSNVTITTQKSATPGDDGVVKLHDITVGDPEALQDATRIGRFTAATADLTGSITITGTLGTLQLRNIADEHTISVGAPETVKDAATFIFVRVENLSIDSLTPIKAITASQWLDTGGAQDTITTPWIASLATKLGPADPSSTGAFQVSLALSGVGAPKGLALGKAAIVGTVSAADWHLLSGGAGPIAAGAFSSTFSLTTPGAVSVLSTSVGDLSGSIAAASLGTVKVKTNVQGLTVALTPVAPGPSLKSLSAVGMFDSSIRSTGSLGAFSFNQIDTSTIFAGVAGSVDDLELPTLISQLASVGASIASVTVKGLADPAAASFARSVIAAGILTKVSLKVVDTTVSTEPYGLAGDVIKSVTRTGGAPISNQSTPAVLDTQNQYRVDVL